MIRKPIGVVRVLLTTIVLGVSLVATALPARAITGGTEDVENIYSNVGMIVFYQPDGRFRCSGTLIAPQVVLTAGHCTFQDIGQVIVTFDPVISRSEEEAEIDIPRAADDEGPDDTISGVGFTEADITPPDYEGEQTWYLGTPYTYPDYSDFTDINNWYDVGVVILNEPVDLPTSPLAPENYLDQFVPQVLNETEFLLIGYGTEVRKSDEGPQKPIPQRQPIVRRYTSAVGQKLTGQILQVNGNPMDNRGGGGSCFGDSGGPALHDGYVVGVASYVYTNNCRFIGGYQRIDIPEVLDWLNTCIADLACATKEEQTAA